MNTTPKGIHRQASLAGLADLKEDAVYLVWFLVSYYGGSN